MKNFLLLAFVAALAVFSVNAIGAPLWQQSLTLSDGGSTAAPLNRQNFYRLECNLPSCFKTSTDAGAAVCGVDSFLTAESSSGAAPVIYNYATNFESASSTFVTATAVDGGQTGCRLFLNSRNLSSTGVYR